MEIFTPAGSGIPLMRNTRAIQAGEMLVKYEPKRMPTIEPLVPVQGSADTAGPQNAQKKRKVKA